MPFSIAIRPRPARRMVAVGSLILAATLAFEGVARSGATAGSIEAGPSMALVVAVDVSQSVDEVRYRLQMDGIARALEDPAVVDAITGGRAGGILFAMVAWAERIDIAVPWVRIQSLDDARALAERVRKLPRYSGEFTCVARMLRNMKDSFLPLLPLRAPRVVVDVSGDGIDNCGSSTDTATARDRLAETGVTINGLPIIEIGQPLVGSSAYRAPGNNMDPLQHPADGKYPTLDDWYRTNVIGGDAAFVLPANGYEDFGRAMRQKFVIEISGTRPRPPLQTAAGRSRPSIGRR